MQGREFNNIGGMNSAMNLQEKLANRVIIQELRKSRDPANTKAFVFSCWCSDHFTRQTLGEHFVQEMNLGRSNQTFFFLV